VQNTRGQGIYNLTFTKMCDVVGSDTTNHLIGKKNCFTCYV